MSRTAIVLFNLGGPDRLAAVEPFLVNLFTDPRDHRAAASRCAGCWRGSSPGGARTVAREIYARIGGGSPLLANTEAQARALEAALGGDHARLHRHALLAAVEPASRRRGEGLGARRGRAAAALSAVLDARRRRSSLAAWRSAAAARVGLDVPTRALCCYPTDAGLHRRARRAARERRCAEWPAGERVRVLLSAHGLPKKIVAAGDPYQWQVERDRAACARRQLAGPRSTCIVCYQSRVGPLEWLEPATDAEIRRAGAERIGLIVVPIAFVSEHSETLVELDLDYGQLADRSGVPRYRRVPTVGADEPTSSPDSPALVRGARMRRPCAGSGRAALPARARRRSVPAPRHERAA